MDDDDDDAVCVCVCVCVCPAVVIGGKRKISTSATNAGIEVNVRLLVPHPPWSAACPSLKRNTRHNRTSAWDASPNRIAGEVVLPLEVAETFIHLLLVLSGLPLDLLDGMHSSFKAVSEEAEEEENDVCLHHE